MVTVKCKSIYGYITTDMAARLPVEVVTHIMRFLSVSDRKEAAVVSHSWYEASLDPILQRDIIIHFYASSAASTGTAIKSLSKRRLPHLVINDFDTSLDAKTVVLKSSEHLAANLKSLSLKGSNITESTFVELLAQCKNLQSLDLSCCNSLFMSGQLLEKNSDIQRLKTALTNVTCVNLSSIRHLSDAIFNRIVIVCENVEKLSLASAQLTFKGNYYNPRDVSRFANSAVLTFQNILDFVITQTCLTSLNFTRTQIEDSHIEEMVCFPELKLQELILVGCRNITDDGIASICKYQVGLETLDIHDCPDLTNSALMSVTMMLGQLKVLHMNKCKQITDRSVSTLLKTNQLEVLDISECSQVTSVGLVKGLCSNTTSFMTHLNLNCCSSVDDIFVEKACEYLPLLSHLDLGSCFPITDISVNAISKSLKYLRFLRLAWCKRITDLGLLGLFSSDGHGDHKHDDEHGQCKCTRKYPSTVIFRKPTDKKEKEQRQEVIKQQINATYLPVTIRSLAGLRHLDLTACRKLTDTSLTQVLKFPELKVLMLGMLPELTNDGVSAIVKSNPSIEELNLSQCGSLTDDTMETITTKLLRLQMLNVFGCDKLTDRSIRLVQQNCSRLRHIDVSFCSGISFDAMEKLETNLKTLLTVQKRMIGSVN